MILVTVGTTEFHGLVSWIVELAPTLHEPVICQIGQGAYVPRHCESFRYAPSLEAYLRRARVVIGHGGLGTLMSAVRLGRPFVGLSNPSRPDQHQDQILGTFEARGHVICCRSLDELPTCIARAAEAQLTPYVEPPCHIPDVILQFLRGNPAMRGAGALQKVGL